MAGDTTMAFELFMSERFPLDLARAPKKVQNSYKKNCFPTLRERPHIADPPKITRIAGYKGLWRYRISQDWRMVYRLDRVANDGTVTMLLLGHKEVVYDRLGSTPSGPGIRIVSNRRDLIEEKTLGDIGDAIHQDAIEGEGKHLPDNPLPAVLDKKALSDWGVNPKYHDAFLSVATEGEFLGLSAAIPYDEFNRVMEGLYPSRIEEVAEQPVRLVEDENQIDQAVKGERTLQSFLLKLDEDQRNFVQRTDKSGPWLLKGGPGSGKSTVALYCIRSILDKARASLLDEAPKILLTTYTNALTRAASQLATELDCSEIEVKTVDKFAAEVLREAKIGLPTFKNEHRQVRDLVNRGIDDCVGASPTFSFTRADNGFLVKEIRWIIIGRVIKTEEDYLAHSRIGCGRALKGRQRSDVWRVYKRYKQQSKELNRYSFAERLSTAASVVTRKYDYVFIDEAQDLSPVAIRLCIKACKTKNIFITADHNQSIYGAGLSWPQVTDELSFAGKSKILQNNYRTTEEMWSGLKQLLPSDRRLDKETFATEPKRHGEFPIISYYRGEIGQIERMNAFLHESLMKERVGPGLAAVLCPSNQIANEIAERLDRSLNAKAMPSSFLDLSHRGVKVMTMHSAKGLQFPVVAVANIGNGMMPVRAPTEEDREEHEDTQRRVLFVACSRSASRLLLMVPRSEPSPFIASLTDDHWEIEDKPTE